MFLNLSARYLLAALNRQRNYLRAIVWGMVVNFALCVFLVPPFGFLGACVAVLGAEVTIQAICYLALDRRVSVRELAAAAARPLLAALGMGLLVAALPRWNVLALAGLGGVAYVALLFLLGTFSEQETQTFRRVGASFGFQGAALLRRAVRRP
jgi:O-antigen/teichoic acid export membrane protein